jgi:hypothetical protein
MNMVSSGAVSIFGYFRTESKSLQANLPGINRLTASTKVNNILYYPTIPTFAGASHEI